LGIGCRQLGATDREKSEGERDRDYGRSDNQCESQAGDGEGEGDHAEGRLGWCEDDGAGDRSTPRSRDDEGRKSAHKVR
jgi:hypothetical protein